MAFVMNDNRKEQLFVILDNQKAVLFVILDNQKAMLPITVVCTDNIIFLGNTGVCSRGLEREWRGR